MKDKQADALKRWFSSPERHREEVLGNLRADVECWEDEGAEGYPGERDIRAMMTRLAIEALGGKVEG